jgi:predicted peroxiredoxin
VVEDQGADGGFGPEFDHLTLLVQDPAKAPTHNLESAAWLATKGYTDNMHYEGMPPLHPLMKEFLDNGGTIWACGACTKPRGITEDHLVEGAAIVGAAKVVEEIAGGAQNITFA